MALRVASRGKVYLLPGELRRSRQSDVRTLILSGSVDFATPAELSVKRLLPYLTNGTQVIISEGGHVPDIWYVNPGNTKRILTGFYDTGLPNTAMNSYLPMDFSVRWGFPVIAKLALALVAVAAVAVASLLAWIVRRYRRRHSSFIRSAA